MGRKKSLHPSDLHRKKQRRKELRKLQKQRQHARREGLRRLAPEKLLAGIRKFNRLKSQEGGLDERTAVKRKRLVNAYQDVMKSRQDAEAVRSNKKSLTISGIGKILGVEVVEETSKQEEKEEEKHKKETTDSSKSDKDDSKKENEPPQIEELEFPPGLPRPIHLCPPPGIRPRPQRQISKPKPIQPNILQKQKTNNNNNRNIANSFTHPQVQVVNHHDMNNRKKWKKDFVPEDFYDPMNPANPFFMQHPKQQARLKQEVKKLERRQRKMAVKQQQQQNQPQQQQQQQQQQNFQRSIQQNQSIVGPLPPTQSDIGPSLPSDLPPLREPGEEGGKLEVLLPDSMMSLRPTALSVKRHAVRRKKKHKQLELAPDVEAGKQQKKIKKGKKAQKTGAASEYDSFLAEIEGLL